MALWEDFEIACTKYLNENFGRYAYFEHLGGSDAGRPDIFVRTNSGKEFYIEAKHCPAQCGQFVLFEERDRREFIWSTANKTNINSHAARIMDYMNDNFDLFSGAGTSGVDIQMTNGQEIFANWIIYVYREKRVRYFITNDYVIFPIEELGKFFDISAMYRIKKSGSKSIGIKNIRPVLVYLKNSYYAITNYQEKNDKLFVNSNRDLDKRKFFVDGAEYMFALRDDKYEIRKLSNTFNANVIFSIKLKNQFSGMTKDEIINALR